MPPADYPDLQKLTPGQKADLIDEPLRAKTWAEVCDIVEKVMQESPGSK